MLISWGGMRQRAEKILLYQAARADNSHCFRHMAYVGGESGHRDHACLIGTHLP